MIRLSQPAIGPEEMRAVQQVLEQKKLAMGQETRLFEEELQQFIGGECQVACVQTGTAALHLALQACGVGPGDEVIVPTVTFVASFQTVSATGAQAIPCDINPENGSIDADDAAKRITDRTRAIMPVHYAGYWGQLDAVYALAKQFNLRVVEDAAHSFGGTRQGRPIGAEGDVICFSFDPIKNITSIDGGAVVSRDSEVIRKVQDLRLLAVEGDTQKRYQGLRSWDFEVHEQGWRYHMNNLCATVGRVQLNRNAEFFAKKQSIIQFYREALSSVSFLRCLDVFRPGVQNHIFPIWVDPKFRNSLRDHLLEQKIETGIQYKPNHLLARYRAPSLLQAEAFYQSVLVLPFHTNLQKEDLQRVVQAIHAFQRIV
jgi:dTDP-4-amino-4,6-dideoxygalactose transaminase